MLIKQKRNIIISYIGDYMQKKKDKYFNKLPFNKQNLFLLIIFSCLNNVLCNDNDSKNRTKTIIILILLIVAIVVILVLVILFIICICCKKRRENIDNYIEGSIAFERGSQEEIELRERITNEGVHVLSNYLKDKLIIDTYSKKFDLFLNKCPICLENFEENKSIIIIGGCLHIFHEKCLSILAEKIDLNKSIFSQFICPTCRNNLMDGIDKIKTCIDIYPNFFGDIYKNKKITKMKHVKNLIEKILKERKDEKKYLKESSSNERLENQKEFYKNKKNTNDNDNDKDISFDNIVIPKNKANNKKKNSKEINRDDVINNINNV